VNQPHAWDVQLCSKQLPDSMVPCDGVHAGKGGSAHPYVLVKFGLTAIVHETVVIDNSCVWFFRIVADSILTKIAV
jgi:hypothetical protein